MTHYRSDRTFTDWVHRHLAIPHIYTPLQWKEYPLQQAYAQQLDTRQGIDYVFRTPKALATVQERFRDSRYARYNDFTLRYRRDYHPDKRQKYSEFFKLNADAMVYGITNGHKQQPETLTGFRKFAVINLRSLFRLIDAGHIRFSEQLHQSRIQAGRLWAPVNQNHDYSSSFVAFDIAQLHQLFAGHRIILLQKGFY